MKRAIEQAHAGEHVKPAQLAEQWGALPGPAKEPWVNASRVLSQCAKVASQEDQREQYAARAVRLLEKARAAGWFTTTARRKELGDPVFKSLRGRADFRALLSKVEAPLR